MDDATAPTSQYDIVILGAGYAGLMAALRLGASENRSRKIALINDCDPFIERVRLQESIARPVPLRIPSISTLLHGTGIDVITGHVADFARTHMLFPLPGPDDPIGASWIVEPGSRSPH